MYDHAQRTHAWSKKRKESWRRKHPESEDSSTLADSESEVMQGDERAGDEFHPLDLYDYGDVPAPQLGGQCRLVCSIAVVLMPRPLIARFLGS